MKTSNFMSGFCWKKITPVRSLVIMFMMIASTTTIAEQSFEALDPEMLEFLELFTADEEELLDIALDEESQASTRQVTGE